MPFTIDKYAALRPYLYHLTATSNIDHLRAAPRLVSTAALLRAAGRDALIREKRRTMTAITVGDRTVILRDQKPLHESYVSLQDGWTFGDFLEALNRRIYFWPGDIHGPKQGGPGHLALYSRQDQPHPSTVLRIPLASLLAANPDHAPYFSAYNFGSPRFNQGRPSPRGPRTCVVADDFDRAPGDVVEVTFLDDLILPPDTAVLPLTPASVVDKRLVGHWSTL